MSNPLNASQCFRRPSEVTDEVPSITYAPERYSISGAGVVNVYFYGDDGEIAQSSQQLTIAQHTGIMGLPGIIFPLDTDDRPRTVWMEIIVVSGAITWGLFGKESDGSNGTGLYVKTASATGARLQALPVGSGLRIGACPWRPQGSDAGGTAGSPAGPVFSVQGVEGMRAIDIQGKLQLSAIITPVLDIAGAYTSGDVFFDATLVPAIVRADDAQGTLFSIIVIDKDNDTPVDVDLCFYRSNVSAGAANAVPSMSDADSLFFLGRVRINAVDWSISTGNQRVVNKTITDPGMGMHIIPKAGTDDIYVVGYVLGAITKTAVDDWKIYIGTEPRA